MKIISMFLQFIARIKKWKIVVFILIISYLIGLVIYPDTDTVLKFNAAAQKAGFSNIPESRIWYEANSNILELYGFVDEKGNLEDKLLLIDSEETDLSKGIPYTNFDIHKNLLINGKCAELTSASSFYITLEAAVNTETFTYSIAIEDNIVTLYDFSDNKRILIYSDSDIIDNPYTVTLTALMYEVKNCSKIRFKIDPEQNNINNITITGFNSLELDASDIIFDNTSYPSISGTCIQESASAAISLNPLHVKTEVKMTSAMSGNKNLIISKWLKPLSLLKEKVFDVVLFLLGLLIASFKVVKVK